MGFAVAFKGVFLEGTEVVLIVISLGAAQHRLGLAALAAAAALVLVAIVGLLVARQLSEVPENTIKTPVGVMLTSFGVFWVGEGAGVNWPGSDLAIPVLVGFFLVSLRLHGLHEDETPRATANRRCDPVTPLRKRRQAFGHFWWDFLIGDTPELALATGSSLRRPSCSRQPLVGVDHPAGAGRRLPLPQRAAGPRRAPRRVTATAAVTWWC